MLAKVNRWFPGNLDWKFVAAGWSLDCLKPLLAVVRPAIWAISVARLVDIFWTHAISRLCRKRTGEYPKKADDKTEPSDPVEMKRMAIQTPGERNEHE